MSSVRWIGLAFVLGCSTEPAPVAAPEEAAAPEGGIDTGAFESPQACIECHPTQVAEWEQSMHAYAALSPVFDAMAAKAYRDTAGEIGTFCTGCHTPIGALQGEPGWMVAADRSELSRKGVSCDACHTAVGHQGSVGNNTLIRDPGGPKQGPFADPVIVEHDAQQSHFITSPELCGSCHDVFMEPGLDIEEAYTEYLESPAADEGVRCQDCHMGPEPGVPSAREVGPVAVVAGMETPPRERSSHRFIGPDVALIDGFPYPDDLERSAAAQEEYKGQVQRLLENSVEISQVELNQTGEGSFQVVVGVQSLTTGHRVPTGFTSERQLWLEVEVLDPEGAVVFETGRLDPNGDLLDSHSLYVARGELPLDEQLFNLQSKNVSVAREWTASGTLSPEGGSETRTEVFPFDANTIIRKSLAPGEVRPASYSFDTALTPAELSVRARLRYRAMPPYVLRALALEELVERVPIFDIDRVDGTSD